MRFKERLTVHGVLPGALFRKKLFTAVCTNANESDTLNATLASVMDALYFCLDAFYKGFAQNWLKIGFLNA